MFNYRGEGQVKSGFYWNMKKWEIVTISGSGGVLPGTNAERYVKLPILLLMAVAPVLGLVYVVFLPFIGFAMLFGLAGRKGLAALRRAVGYVGKAVSAVHKA